MPFIPNPYSELLQDPNLGVPKKKPLGSVKIEHGGIAKDLCFFSLSGRDLVSKVAGVSHSSVNVKYNENGQYYDGNGTEGYLEWPGYKPLVTSDGAGDGDFTMLVIAAPVSSSTQYSLISQGVYQGNQTYILANTGTNWNGIAGSISFYTYDSGYKTAIDVNGYIDENWHVYVARRRGTILEIFVDGFSVVSLNGPVRNILDANVEVSIGCITGYTNWDAVDPISDGMMWDRALPDIEILSISKDPYQFLIPA